MSADRSTVALVGGLVWSGTSTAIEPERADVLITDRTITAIGTGLDLSGAEVVDVEGATVTPGLVDAHVHLSFAGLPVVPGGTAAITARAVGHLRSFLAAGVTAVRDNGGLDGIVVAVRQAVQRGWVRGPVVLTANQYVSATGGHGAPRWGQCGCLHPLAGCAADGPDGLRRAVRAQIAAGADHIKMTLNSGRNRVELTEAEMRAAVDEAHRMGLRVAVHASIPEAVALAVQCGVDTIEHGNGATEDVLREMAARGTTLVPTAHAFRDGLARSEAEVAAGGVDDATLALHRSWQRRVDDHVETLRLARLHGVRLALGTDVFGPEPVAPIALEAAAIADLGIAPLDVLRAATSGGAAALGRPELGVLREGGPADVAAFTGRPDLDPTALGRPVAVVRDGWLVRP